MKSHCYYTILSEKIFVRSIIMVKSGEIKIAKETFYATKMPIKSWEANVDNIVILKLVTTKTNSKYLIGY